MQNWYGQSDDLCGWPAAAAAKCYSEKQKSSTPHNLTRVRRMKLGKCIKTRICWNVQIGPDSKHEGTLFLNVWYSFSFNPGWEASEEQFNLELWLVDLCHGLQQYNDPIG